jgi:sulfonate transport system substrate-binding protein
MNTFLKGLVGALALAGLAAGLSAPAMAQDKTVRIGIQKYGKLILLKAKGSLEKKLEPLGFTVTWTEFPAGPQLLEAVNVGAIDFGNTGEAPPIFAQAAGAPLLYVAHEPPAPRGEAILVPKDSPIKTVADLKGKLVGVLSLAAGTVPTVKAMAREAGIDPASVQFVAVGADAAALVALKGARVDALSFFIGSVAGLENLGMKFRAFSPDVSSGVFVTSNALLAKNRDLVVRGLQGVALSTRFAQLNPAAAARNYYAMFQQPTGDRDQALRNDVHTIEKTMTIFKQPNDGRRWGELTEADWNKLIAFAGPEFGLKPEDTRYADFVNGELITDVNTVDMALAETAAKTASAR